MVRARVQPEDLGSAQVMASTGLATRTGFRCRLLHDHSNGTSSCSIQLRDSGADRRGQRRADQGAELRCLPTASLPSTHLSQPDGVQVYDAAGKPLGHQTLATTGTASRPPARPRWPGAGTLFATLPRALGSVRSPRFLYRSVPTAKPCRCPTVWPRIWDQRAVWGKNQLAVASSMGIGHAKDHRLRDVDGCL